jgi:hypothetical protein
MNAPFSHDRRRLPRADVWDPFRQARITGPSSSAAMPNSFSDQARTQYMSSEEIGGKRKEDRHAWFVYPQSLFPQISPHILCNTNHQKHTKGHQRHTICTKFYIKLLCKERMSLYDVNNRVRCCANPAHLCIAYNIVKLSDKLSTFHISALSI